MAAIHCKMFETKHKAHCAVANPQPIMFRLLQPYFPLPRSAINCTMRATAAGIHKHDTNLTRGA